MNTAAISLLSQNEIRKYLPRKGFFVDVGAYDGMTNSNTRELADNGWRGVFIEPVIEYALLCQKRHPQIPVITVAAGNKNGLVTMYIDGQISSCNQDFINAVKNIHFFAGRKYTNTRTVYQTTLDSILSTIPEIDFLSIDVEGQETAVLEGFSVEKWKPSVIMVELYEESPEWNGFNFVNYRKNRVYEILKDYKAVYKDDTNTIFVR